MMEACEAATYADVRRALATLSRHSAVEMCCYTGANPVCDFSFIPRLSNGPTRLVIVLSARQQASPNADFRSLLCVSGVESRDR